MRSVADPSSDIYSSLFAAETVKKEQDQLLRLVSLDVPTLGLVNIVDNNSNVTLEGITYNKFPIQFSEISVTNDGTINKASLLVANPNRTFAAYIEQYDGLRNVPVTVKSVFAKFLDGGSNPNPNAAITDYFVIDSYSETENVITFQLDPVADLEARLPRRAYSATSCFFRYKDSETCGYSGNIATCKKTLEDCKVHYVLDYSTGTVSFPLTSQTATFSGANLTTAGVKVGDTLRFSPTVYFTVASVTSSTELKTKEINTSADYVGTNYSITRGNQKRFGGQPGINPKARHITL